MDFIHYNTDNANAENESVDPHWTQYKFPTIAY